MLIRCLVFFTFIGISVASNHEGSTCSNEILSINETTGSISPSGITNLNGENRFCRWKIVVPADQQIVVRFLSFNIPFVHNCPDEYLEIYDGPTTSSPRFLDRRLCGNQAFRDFLSTSNEILVVYFLTDTKLSPSFSISWSTEVACQTEQFKCWNGNCISEMTKCDGNSDCHDNSDEMECANRTSYGECGRSSFPPFFSATPRIIGGQETTKGSWPWYTMLVHQPCSVRSYDLLCGGSIISDRWILTAAHCLITQQVYNYCVYVGKQTRLKFESSEQQLSVAEIVIHPSYTDAIGGNDVALLRVDRKIVFNEYVGAVCVPQSITQLPFAGSTCVAIGFGKYEYGSAVPVSEALRQVRLNLNSRAFCGGLYSIIDGVAIPYPPSILCAGDAPSNNRDVCQGDSGGPLLCLDADSESWMVIGVASFVVIPCGTLPSFYANVAQVVEWINDAAINAAPSGFDFFNAKLLLLPWFICIAVFSFH